MFVYYNGESESLEKCCVYYESIKRELNMRLIYACQCDERLKGEGSIRLTYTGFRGGLEHLKIHTDEVNRREVCEGDG